MYQIKRVSIIMVALLAVLAVVGWQQLQAKEVPHALNFASVVEGTQAQMLAEETAVSNARTLHLDVAEAGTRFIFDEAPVFEDGMPAYGNSFITEGYIYPAGTLSESNGVLPNGVAEFPDLVLGKWTCRGYFIGNGAYTETGPWVVTTQIFDLGQMPGTETIVTEGFELSDIGITGYRAITGGTGEYSRARGQMSQVLTGFNETMGVNLQVELNINK